MTLWPRMVKISDSIGFFGFIVLGVGIDAECNQAEPVLPGRRMASTSLQQPDTAGVQIVAGADHTEFAGLDEAGENRGGVAQLIDDVADVGADGVVHGV